MFKKIFKYKFLIVLMAMFAVIAISIVRADEPTTVDTYGKLTTALASGGSIKLGADISATQATWIQKDVVLDLNGHTLNLGTNKIYVLSNSTFKDSSGDNSGKISGTGSYQVCAGYVSGGTSYPGSLTIESGTFVTSGNGFLRVYAPGTLKVNGGVVQSAQYPVYVSASGASFSMNGGTVCATSAVGVYTVVGSEFTMNGGMVQAPQQVVSVAGDTIINGGTVKATSQIGVYVRSGELTINGGTIHAPTDAINIKDNVNANVNIENGTIAADDRTGIYVGTGTTLTVNGGSITADYAAINNSGNLIMNGGKVASNNSSDMPTIQVHGASEDQKATFTMNGGKIEALGAGGAAVNLKSDATLTINGGTIEALANNGAGITAFKDTEVTINDGTISSYSYALAGNGSDSGENEGTNAKFTVTGGTLTSSNAAGIYAPQVNGVTNISGGTITGGMTGVEVRAGELNITGGTITGNQERYEFTENTNGLTTTGAAVSVCQHTTKQPINLNISGGTFYGYVPLSEDHLSSATPEDMQKINYNVSGGVFHSSGNKTVSVKDYPNGEFITGGLYTHDVEQYVKDGYGEKPKSSMIAVYPWQEISWKKESKNGSNMLIRYKTIYDDGTTIITEPDGQEPIADPNDPTILKLRTLYGDKIVVNATPNEGCELFYVKAVDKDGNTIEVSDDSFCLAPNSDSNAMICYAQVVSKEVDPSMAVENIDVGVKNKKQADRAMIKALRDDATLFAKVEDTEPTIRLVINKIEPTESDTSAVLKKVGNENASLLAFYDTYISVEDENGEEVGRMTKLSEKIELAMALPEDMLKAFPEGKYEKYYILGKNGGYNIMDFVSSEGGRVKSFETNFLSKYALVWSREDNDIPGAGYDWYEAENGSDNNEYGSQENNGSGNNESGQNSSSNPETGDENPIILIGLALSSSLALIIFLI